MSTSVVLVYILLYYYYVQGQLPKKCKVTPCKPVAVQRRGVRLISAGLSVIQCGYKSNHPGIPTLRDWMTNGILGACYYCFDAV